MGKKHFPSYEKLSPAPLADVMAKEAQDLVYRRRRVRLMLLHIDGAKCLSPLVSAMNLEQLDAMLNLLSSTATLESL